VRNEQTLAVRAAIGEALDAPPQERVPRPAQDQVPIRVEGGAHPSLRQGQPCLGEGQVDPGHRFDRLPESARGVRNPPAELVANGGTRCLELPQPVVERHPLLGLHQEGRPPVRQPVHDSWDGRLVSLANQQDHPA